MRFSYFVGESIYVAWRLITKWGFKSVAYCQLIGLHILYCCEVASYPLEVVNSDAEIMKLEVEAEAEAGEGEEQALKFSLHFLNFL